MRRWFRVNNSVTMAAGFDGDVEVVGGSLARSLESGIPERDCGMIVRVKA